MARDEGFKIKKYHSDNCIFSSADFKDHCDSLQIKYSFSGVGAKHQHGVAERNIKTVAQWARANMLHLAHIWPQYADSKYWLQAINYATWVFNILPNMESGISPDELWSNVKNNDNVLRRAHVFGCPVYVLNAALHDGKKIPKWAPWACLGLFLGFSDLHSSQVPLVLNVETKKISPQYHVIFDDNFHTVNSLPNYQPINVQWKEILCLDRECFADVDYDKTGQQILPLLGDIIKTFRKDCNKWPSQDPITPLIDSYYDDLVWDNQDVTPTQDLLQMPTTSNIWTETFAPGGDNTYNQQNNPSPTTTPSQSQNSPLLLPGGEQFIPNEELMG